MVGWAETKARIKEFYGFNQHEYYSLTVVILVTAFVFSFNDWGGEGFNLIQGLENLWWMVLVVAITFFFRLSCQKIYGLAEGHKVEFKPWWTGVIIMVVLAFMSAGISRGKFVLPLFLVGGVSISLMIKQRLGEFRYGFSNWEQGIISMWGVYANLILAILFAIGVFAWPQSYFFKQGLYFNLILPLCGLIPIPQQEGLNIIFAARWLYLAAFILILLAAVLLLTHTFGGLIFAVVFATVFGLIYILIGSEK